MLTAFIFAVFAVTAAAQRTASTDGIEITIINADELKELAKSPARAQPIVINFWATWCGPCQVEFPDLVKIEAEYRAQGLDFALVSVDSLGLVRTTVPEFLRQYEAGAISSYLLDYPTRREITRAVRRIAPAFSDRYPLTLLFDAKGRLVYQKVGVINPKILRAQIKKVLGNK